MRLIPAATIAARLGERLDVSGAASRDLPQRQRSLGEAIGWSYDLLEPPVRHLFARLSVFRGGFRLEEAEAICGPAAEIGIDVLSGLSVLADNSLVHPTRGRDGARFELINTIRSFAGDRLDVHGETPAMRRRHALAYLDMAEAAAGHIPGGEQLPWPCSPPSPIESAPSDRSARDRRGIGARPGQQPHRVGALLRSAAAIRSRPRLIICLHRLG